MRDEDNSRSGLLETQDSHKELCTSPVCRDSMKCLEHPNYLHILVVGHRTSFMKLFFSFQFSAQKFNAIPCLFLYLEMP